MELRATNKAQNISSDKVLKLVSTISDRTYNLKEWLLAVILF